MENLLKTRFGCLIYFLGVNMFLLFSTVLRSYYEIPLFLDGIIIILLSQLIPYWTAQYMTNKIFAKKNVKFKAILWFLLYVSFFAVIWLSVKIIYPERI
ncbi:hypothetical protein GCM10007416_34590 [Kroppenstedtia guangzhouensis]|uniref:Uncharacterized protein n=1 Tax=Kroppenstedtia guangzhouensis TaxID=1274356 RepID=A0ABQ1H6J6_9BACL|nr:hypothetical protein GCM10007416_34590 [Kroppenstedtia guangzhouensis]